MEIRQDKNGKKLSFYKTFFCLSFAAFFLFEINVNSTDRFGNVNSNTPATDPNPTPTSSLSIRFSNTSSNPVINQTNAPLTDRFQNTNQNQNLNNINSGNAPSLDNRYVPVPSQTPLQPLNANTPSASADNRFLPVSQQTTTPDSSGNRFLPVSQQPALNGAGSTSSSTIPNPTSSSASSSSGVQNSVPSAADVPPSDNTQGPGLASSPSGSSSGSSSTSSPTSDTPSTTNQSDSNKTSDGSMTASPSPSPSPVDPPGCNDQGIYYNSQKKQYCQAAEELEKAANSEQTLMLIWGAASAVCIFECVYSSTTAGLASFNQYVCPAAMGVAGVTELALSKGLQSDLEAIRNKYNAPNNNQSSWREPSPRNKKLTQLEKEFYNELLLTQKSLLNPKNEYWKLEKPIFYSLPVQTQRADTSLKIGNGVRVADTSATQGNLFDPTSAKPVTADPVGTVTLPESNANSSVMPSVNAVQGSPPGPGGAVNADAVAQGGEPQTDLGACMGAAASVFMTFSKASAMSSDDDARKKNLDSVQKLDNQNSSPNPSVTFLKFLDEKISEFNSAWASSDFSRRKYCSGSLNSIFNCAFQFAPDTPSGIKNFEFQEKFSQVTKTSLESFLNGTEKDPRRMIESSLSQSLNGAKMIQIEHALDHFESEYQKVKGKIPRGTPRALVNKDDGSNDSTNQNIDISRFNKDYDISPEDLALNQPLDNPNAVASNQNDGRNYSQSRPNRMPASEPGIENNPSISLFQRVSRVYQIYMINLGIR